MVDIDADEVFTLVNETAKDQGRNNDEEMFDTDVLNDEKVFAENVDFAKQAKEVVADKDIFDDITLAKALMEIKKEQAHTPIISIQQPLQVKVQDKGKAKIIEEPVKLKNKEQIKLDKELTFKLQAKKEKEEERLAKEKAQRIKEVNLAWDDVQVKIKPRSLKNKSFAEIHELFDKAMKRINTFVDLRTELVKESTKKDEAKIAQESSSKRAGDELEQERSNKKKVEDDIESEELMKCLEIIPDDGYDVTIYATPLSSNSPTIVDYKIYKEGKKSYIQIFRVDDNS
nr:hypothetical protein [Tanacetum cinerariifolium]